jgi:hypothetical protein
MMLDRKKTLKTTKGIVARRKPKKTGVGASNPSNKKECDLRKFNLSLPNDLFLQVAAAAAANNMKINAFISNALRAELNLPTITSAPASTPKSETMTAFFNEMSALDWAEMMQENKSYSYDHVG